METALKRHSLVVDRNRTMNGAWLRAKAVFYRPGVCYAGALFNRWLNATSIIRAGVDLHACTPWPLHTVCSLHSATWASHLDQV